jgi:hypothetical protein
MFVGAGGSPYAACATEGVCRGCGTVGELHPDPHMELLWHFVFRHEDWCPVRADGDAA